MLSFINPGFVPPPIHHHNENDKTYKNENCHTESRYKDNQQLGGGAYADTAGLVGEETNVYSHSEVLVCGEAITVQVTNKELREQYNNKSLTRVYS